MKISTFWVLLVFFPYPSLAQWKQIELEHPIDFISVSDSQTVWTFNERNAQFTHTVSRTTDGGQTWTTTAAPYFDQVKLTADLEAVDSVRAWLFFQEHPSYDKHIFSTVDGGQTWSEHDLLGENEHLVQMRFLDAQTGVLVSNEWPSKALFRRTDDGGATWNAQEINIQGSLLEVANWGKNHWWLYTGSGVIWHSGDGGATWDAYDTGILATSYGLAMAFADSLNGLGLVNRFSNQIVRTTDGGQSWAIVPGTAHEWPDPAYYTWSLTAVPGAAGHWMIGDNAGFHFTANYGATWRSDVDFPDYAFHHVHVPSAQSAWALYDHSSNPYILKQVGNFQTATTGCVQFLSPLEGHLQRNGCYQMSYVGSVKADIAQDSAIHLRTIVRFPQTSWGKKVDQYDHLQTGCPNCWLNFVPDTVGSTVGTLQFEVPLCCEYDTTHPIFVTISPTACYVDSVQSDAFHLGYWANWYHPECFDMDTVGETIQFLSNLCANDPNQYVVFAYNSNTLPYSLGTSVPIDTSYDQWISFRVYVDTAHLGLNCYRDFSLLYNPAPDPPIDTTSHTLEVGESRLMWYPNPAQSETVLYWQASDVAPIWARVVDVSGREWWRSTNTGVAPKSWAIDTRQWPSGVYFAQAALDNGHFYTAKLVVGRL